MQSLIITIFWLFYDVKCEYNMAPYLTCWEQNNQDPKGFTDPIWINNNTDQCRSLPHLCEKYQTEGQNPGRGDVCDHSIQGQLPNMCYFNVIFLPEIDPQKSWTYKCWHDSLCPVKDSNGIGVTGCLITSKRISCCCNEADYCNGQELFKKYALWGRPDYYPPNFTVISTYDKQYPLLQSLPPSTAIPTIFPSETPTISPTTEPTLEPTTEPTLEPTQEPSLEPTDFPTTNPSYMPTNIPSISPTLMPSDFPSFFPTFNPSVTPSNNPTNIPTFNPSENPSILRTFPPTKNPSILRTFPPTKLSNIYSPVNSVIVSTEKTNDSENYSLFDFNDSTTISIIYGLIGGGLIGLILGILLFMIRKYCKQKQKRNINKINSKNKKEIKKNKYKLEYDNISVNEQTEDIEESIDPLESEQGKSSDFMDKKMDIMTVPIIDQTEDKVDILIDDESEIEYIE